ncbi:uncharacterized protein LOC125497006 [Beta vulgaris subsp. vulgaris]|uniref:uncharacterized protein LOC125497006 n=1 Tax=Beta vulgaris subsp. vulgaris TaxID=3555 RepID=UPI002036DA12|nr:uncharacterized protein LOC125497006 [Beta vulgaris subsp. vulgaris]
MGIQEGREALIFGYAIEGNTRILDRANITQYGESSYLSRTPSLGNNIIHLAARSGKTTFVDAAIRLFPDLLWQKNNNDNTVVHEAAAEMGTKDCVRFLISYLKSSMSSSTTSSASDHNRSNATAIAVPFLLERNCDGETPFHVALRCRNMAAAEELFADVNTRQQILHIKNNCGETPLHLYARYCAGGTFPKDLEHDDNHNVVDKPKFIKALITANSAAIFEQDSDGFIPVMRAAQYGRVHAVLWMLSYKQSTECRDLKGRNVLHHLRLRIADLNARDKDYTFWICKKILALCEVYTLIFLQDKDGNTPLHLAIMDRDFDIAELILK